MSTDNSVTTPEVNPTPTPAITSDVTTSTVAINPQVIAVVGPFRSGTSCIAGVLHTLGVSMGRQFMPSAPANSKGFFEAIGLRKICGMIYPRALVVQDESSMPLEKRVQMLRQHIQRRIGDSDPLGVKHPTLCLMVPEMVEAWPGVKIVSVTRSVDDAIASMNRPGLFPMASEEQRRASIQHMLDVRDKNIEAWKVEHLDVNYKDALTDPQAIVDALIGFAGIQPTESQMKAAVEFIDQDLCHHGSEEVASNG